MTTALVGKLERMPRGCFGGKAVKSRWRRDRSAPLHLFERLNTEHFEPLLEDSAGQTAEHQSRRPLGAFGLQHRAGFVEAGEVAGQIVKVIAKKVRPRFLRHGFQHQAEVEK